MIFCENLIFISYIVKSRMSAYLPAEIWGIIAELLNERSFAYMIIVNKNLRAIFTAHIRSVYAHTPVNRNLMYLPKYSLAFPKNYPLSVNTQPLSCYSFPISLTNYHNIVNLTITFAAALIIEKSLVLFDAVSSLEITNIVTNQLMLFSYPKLASLKYHFREFPIIVKTSQLDCIDVTIHDDGKTCRVTKHIMAGFINSIARPSGLYIDHVIIRSPFYLYDEHYQYGLVNSHFLHIRKLTLDTQHMEREFLEWCLHVFDSVHLCYLHKSIFTLTHRFTPRSRNPGGVIIFEQK